MARRSIKEGRVCMQITIDPGTNGSGYAIWNKSWDLMTHGVLSSNGKTWDIKMHDIAKKLKMLVKEHGIKTAFIEEPRKFHGTFGNMVADRGDLVKLSIFVGYVSGYLGIDVDRIPVIAWKGQLPKDVVIKRIKRILPNIKAKSHDWDAIGIGLYLKGVF